MEWKLTINAHNGTISWIIPLDYSNFESDIGYDHICAMLAYHGIGIDIGIGSVSNTVSNTVSGIGSGIGSVSGGMNMNMNTSIESMDKDGGMSSSSSSSSSGGSSGSCSSGSNTDANTHIKNTNPASTSTYPKYESNMNPVIFDLQLTVLSIILHDYMYNHVCDVGTVGSGGDNSNISGVDTNPTTNTTNTIPKLLLYHI